MSVPIRVVVCLGMASLAAGAATAPKPPAGKGVTQMEPVVDDVALFVVVDSDIAGTVLVYFRGAVLTSFAPIDNTLVIPAVKDRSIA